MMNSKDKIFSPFDDDNRLMQSGQVRKYLGGICYRTLYNWREKAHFPKPYMIMHKKNFWRYGDVRDWMAERHANMQPCRSVTPKH